MLQTLTMDQCIERTRKYFKKANYYKVAIVNAENRLDYEGYKSAILTTAIKISLSSYCTSCDENPDLEKMFESVIASNENILLVGVSAFLKLHGESTLNKVLRRLCGSTVQGKVIVLCFQIEKQLKELYKNDHRLEQQIYLIQGESDSLTEVTLVDQNLTLGDNKKFNVGIKELLHELEECTTTCRMTYTMLKKSSFPNSLITIREINGVYDAILILYNELYGSIQYCYGSDKQWTYLLSLLSEHGNVQNVLKSKFQTVSNLELAFSKWMEFSTEEKWLYFIALKINGTVQSLCLSKAITSATNLESFTILIYRGILDKNIMDSDYVTFYNDRKRLIKDLDENYAVDYCNYTKKKGADQIYYLTDNTVFERKQIVECLCDLKYEEHAISEILELVYPDLFNYLKPFWFNNILLDEYFQRYKVQKITNVLHDDFLTLVNRNAGERGYNSTLPFRSEKTEGINKENAFMYFVDALGVEFLGFIMAKCKIYNLRATVTICHSNLPSITSENKDFLMDFNQNDYYSFKDLDDIKHHGAFDFNYSNTKLPIHITKELEIIDNLIKRSKTQLVSGKYRKIIFMSDHGSSRLAVIANQDLVNIDVDVKGLHSGRCCEYNDQIPEIEYATEERGYYVLANYKRFKGSRAAGVEAHGGATLEEVVIPIIELTLQSKNIEIEFVKPIVSVSYKKSAELIVFSKTALANFSLLIDGKFYSGTSEDGHNYQVSIPDIKKAGDYYADAFEDNNLLVEKLQFIIEKESSKEKDMFDLF